jgi:hypothetical protein
MRASWLSPIGDVIFAARSKHWLDLPHSCRVGATALVPVGEHLPTWGDSLRSIQENSADFISESIFGIFVASSKLGS